MKLKTMLAVVATAAAVPLTGWAGEPTGPQGTFLNTPYPYTYPAFVTMDRNGDGIITRDEYAAATGTLPPPAPVVAAPVIAAPVVTAPVVAAPMSPCSTGAGSDTTKGAEMSSPAALQLALRGQQSAGPGTVNRG